jgi:hypothetical protein
LVNSRYPRFSATLFGSPRERFTYGGRTFSRSYGAILPSSLERLLSSALVYSTRPPESVCGTVTKGVNSAAAFLGSLGSLSSRPQSGLLITSRDDAPPFVPSRVLEELPTGLNRAIHAPAQLPFSVPAAETVLGGTGILTCFPSPTPFGLGLGTD